MPPTIERVSLNIETIKLRQKMTWESGDCGEIARYNIPAAEEFMARLNLRPGMQVLDAACGTGNLAVIASRAGCEVAGLDIASNLIVQARKRAYDEDLLIEYTEGDVEALPYPDASFDVVVSMFGAMFAPRPERVVNELLRVTRPGGMIALANWTPRGFIGKMFDVFGRHIAPPQGVPSPLDWGDEDVVRARLAARVGSLQLTRRMARLCYPFPPAGTVDFFRRFYGPTQRAFASLRPAEQSALRRELVELQARCNLSADPCETDTPSEYLEVHAWRPHGLG